MACGSAGTPNLLIELNAQNIIQLHEITEQYVYVIDGLPLRDIDDFTQPSPCQPGLRSRWQIVDQAECVHTTMGEQTNATLVDLLLKRGNSDLNQDLRDITFPWSGQTCDPEAETLVEVEIIIGSQCFRRGKDNQMLAEIAIIYYFISFHSLTHFTIHLLAFNIVQFTLSTGVFMT